MDPTVGPLPTGIDVDYLVRDDELHRSIYTDPAIFDLEMDRIFSRTWVFVGHESEIPTPGDYKTTWIGRQPVILSRAEDGTLHCLFNRCRHRAASVCQAETGTANFFRCAYHGWTYRNSGQLTGVPFAQSYPKGFTKSELGLVPVPRLESYRGFVFASLARDVADLKQHLAAAREYVDIFIECSPNHQVYVRHGAHKVAYDGNWKLQLENGTDGYHPAFTHKSVAEIHERRIGGKPGSGMAAYRRKTDSVSRGLGNGHAMLDQRGATGTSYIDRLLASPGGSQTIEKLRRERPVDEVDDMCRRAAGHGFNLTIFPNLLLIGVQIRILRPIAVNRTEVRLYPTMLGGLPDELNAMRLRYHEEFFGPAGFGSPDDIEMFDRAQTGLQVSACDWLVVSRGLDTERVEDGVHTGELWDETPVREHYRTWKHLMRQA
jgi:phenylpropionate dioxygenase-like ring-hydroxylating dioxygenase large terminal subunit